MAEEISPEIVAKVRSITGLVRLEGPISWTQQQMIEKLDDPMAQRLAKVVQELDISKRYWDRALAALSKSES